jgi:hypothetical protein
MFRPAMMMIAASAVCVGASEISWGQRRGWRGKVMRGRMIGNEGVKFGGVRVRYLWEVVQEGHQHQQAESNYRC